MDYEAVLANIGDTTKLTTEEQGEFRDVFSAIIEKYKLLGPEGIRVVRHFQDLKNSIPIPTLRDFTSNLFDFHDIQIATQSRLADTVTWLDRQNEAFKSEAVAEASAKLNDFYEMQRNTQTELAETTAWLDELYDSLEETDSATGNLTITLAALAGGMGGATGQGINLALALHQSNIELDNAQKAGKRLDEEGFSPAQMGAAALSGALQDLGSEIGGAAGAFLSAAGNIASAFATGGPAAAAIAGIMEGVKGLGAVFNNFANGAQMALNDVKDAFKAMGDAIFSGEINIEVAVNIATIKKSNWWGGYDREATQKAQEEAQEHYEYMKGLQANFLEAGFDAEQHMSWERRRLAATTAEEIVALYSELHEAGLQAFANVEFFGGPTGEEIQDFARLNEVWAMLDETGQVTAQATENYAQKLLEARDAGIELTEAQNALADNAELIAAFEAASSAAVGAFRASEAAGVKAYDETTQASADYHAAVADGDEKLAAKIIEDNGLWVTNTEEAHARGSAAALAASTEVLAAKGVEYARISAFEAAMALGAHATAAERIEAARTAATAASESWDAAMVAVIASDKAAADAIDGTWNPESGDVVNDIKNTTTQLENEIADLEQATKGTFDEMAKAAGLEAGKMDEAFTELFDPHTGQMITDVEGVKEAAETAFNEMSDPSKANSISKSIALAQKYLHDKLINSDGSMTADFASLAENAKGSTSLIQASIDGLTGKSINIKVNHHTTYSSEGKLNSGVGDVDESRAHGSPGLNFEEWGSGTPVVLHGQEAVVRSDQADEFIERHGGKDEDPQRDEALYEEIKGLRRDIVDALITQPVKLASLLDTRR